MNDLNEVLHWLQVAETTDIRQSWKVKHKFVDIVALVFLTTLTNANVWELIEGLQKHTKGF